MKPDERKLIIVRHAHRDKTKGRERDNGISKKGRKQSLNIRTFYRNRFGKGVDAVLWTSPKKRCYETLQPLSEYLGTDIEVHSELDEIQNGESYSAFQRRIETFLNNWKKSKEPITVACSHGDWIPTLTKKLIGLDIGLAKGGWIEIEGTKNPKLIWICQRL